MNDRTEIAGGIAFVCNGAGEIQQLIRDDLGVAATTESFFDAIDKLSVEKARNFLSALQKDGASFGWELNATVRGRITPIVFNGGPSGSEFLIVGAATRLAVEQLTEELTLINSEQSTALRAALKELSLQQRARLERDSGVFDELSRLNNELVTLQRELAQKNRDLEKLNRLKDTFLGMASHDLRKPVSAIISSADLLSSGQSPPAETAQTIKRSCEKVIRQLNDFLDIAQIEAGTIKVERRMIDFAGVVRARVELYARFAKPKGISVVCDIPETIPNIALDQDRIEQVIDNLIENAIKYSPAGEEVAVQLHAASGQALLSVSDRGAGMSAEQMKDLFTAFRTVGSKVTGKETSTGLGLAISKAIVDRHGGRIEVKSNPGTGSTFTVRLPIE